MELGPCRILDGNGTKFHPESWNSNANIFFVDQPIGVGFSYADYGETVVRVSSSYHFPRLPNAFRVRQKRQPRTLQLSWLYSSRISASSRGGLSTWQGNPMGYASLVLYLRIRPSFTDPVLGSVPPRLCLRSLRPECESCQSRAHTNQFDIGYDRKRIYRPLFNGRVLLRYDLYSCYAIAHSEHRVSVNLASRFPGSEYCFAGLVCE